MSNPNPIDKVQKAISDIEDAYLDTMKIIGCERRTFEILAIPREIEKFIKERLLIRGLISNRSGLKWNDDEDKQLVSEVILGATILDISKTHKRSTYAIEKRIEKLVKDGYLVKK